MKNIEKLALELGNIENVRREIKRVQSIKSRLKKQKARKDYAQRMTETLQYEQQLKEVREYFEPKKKPVTQFNQQDVDRLTYDETVKAIKSIQSKKSLSQFLTEDINENEEYQNALKIEEMLKEHREKVKPVEDNVIKKSRVANLIDHLENQDTKLDKEYVLEQLKKLLEEE